MDIWLRNEPAEFNAIVITITGRMNDANIRVGGHLLEGPDQHMVISHNQEERWDEDQTCGPDWLKDALTALVERL